MPYSQRLGLDSRVNIIRQDYCSTGEYRIENEYKPMEALPFTYSCLRSECPSSPYRNKAKNALSSSIPFSLGMTVAKIHIFWITQGKMQLFSINRNSYQICVRFTSIENQQYTRQQTTANDYCRLQTFNQRISLGG